MLASWSRPGRSAAAVCLVVALTACASAQGAQSGSEVGGGGGQVEQAGWTRVDVGGTVHAIAGHVFGGPLIAAGGDDEAPLLVRVDGEVARPVPDPDGEAWRSPDGGYEAVEADGELIGLVGRDDPSAVLLHHDLLAYPPVRLQDAQGREASWVAPLLDGEENTRVVGAVETARGWRLHAWQAVGEDEWRALDSGEQLHLSTAPSRPSLLTGTTEVEVVVAGPVSDGPRAGDAAPEVWSISDTPEDSGGRWRQSPTGTVADGFTDLAFWDLGWWVAGHRDGRPVVYDFDRGNGAALPVPDTQLDPEHPLTIVAGIPVERPLTLATQSVDGPVVWVGTDADWTRTPGPAGRLSAAQRVVDDVYLVVDGRLWVRTLPEAAVQPS